MHSVATDVVTHQAFRPHAAPRGTGASARNFLYQEPSYALLWGGMDAPVDRHCPPAPPEYAPAHLRLGLALLEEDRPEEARAALQGAPSADEATVDPTVIPLHHWALAYSSWLVGRWDSVALEVGAGLAAADASRGALHGAALAGVGVLVAVHQDDLVAARDLLTKVQHQLAAEVTPCPLWSQGAEALLLEAEGQPEMALQVMADGWAQAEPVGHLSAYRLFGPALVRLALRYGDRQQAALVVEEVEERATRLAAVAAQGAALRCRGMLEEDPETLLRAVRLLREVPRPLELASACEEAATSLKRKGRDGLATSLFLQALTSYQSLGATRDIARIAWALTSHDDLALPARTESHPVARRTGPGSELTCRELEVLGLMAMGVGGRAMAERLFVSHNTVRNHAQSILRKLGAHSRLEAVSVARRKGILQPPSQSEEGSPSSGPSSTFPGHQ